MAQVEYAAATTQRGKVHRKKRRHVRAHAASGIVTRIVVNIRVNTLRSAWVLNDQSSMAIRGAPHNAPRMQQLIQAVRDLCGTPACPVSLSPGASIFVMTGWRSID
jgi:hypothetical protein